MKNLFILVIVFAISAGQLQGQGPRITSVYPLGARQGTTAEAEIRGQNLDGAYAVWFDCNALHADVIKVEEVKPDTKEGDEQKAKEGGKKQRTLRVVVKVKIDPAAKIGAHALRLVSPYGVSDPLVFLVNSEDAVLEGKTVRRGPNEAQEVSFPGIVNGIIGQTGERDRYAINVQGSQELMFKVITGAGLLETAPGRFNQPELVLYEPSRSWFDPLRVRRLKCNDESMVFTFPRGSNYVSHYLPQLTCRFDKPGKYLVEVGELGDHGGPDYAYQLRITPVPAAPQREEQFYPALAHTDGLDWQDREFGRKIEPDRLRTLWSRTARIPKKDEKITGSSGSTRGSSAQGAIDSGNEGEGGTELSSPYLATPLPLLREKEPNETPGHALEFTAPTIIEGTIEHPGDVDYFKFRLKSREPLAFEIETPELRPAYFNPRLGIFDENEREVLTNVYRKVAGDGDDWVKTIEPKTIYTFEAAGEYYLQIRDLTSRKGNSKFRYRILVRPQIPHMGRVVPKTFGIVGIENEEDRINLVPGEAKKLVVVSDREEGFEGEFALSVENLPPGVQVLPSAAERQDLPSQEGQVYEMRGEIHLERFRPRRLATTLVLLANADAPLTSMPQFIRLCAQPIVITAKLTEGTTVISEGKPGRPVPVYELPLMVIKRREMNSEK